MRSGTGAHLCDRRDDSARHPADEHKPPILKRSVVRLLCLACLSVIIYGTVGPIGLGGGKWLVRNPDWQSVPPITYTDFNDLFTNAVVYVPVGIALRLLFRRRQRSGVLDFLLGLSFAVGLSYGTEVAQQFIPARSSNLIDVFVNGGAAAIGCLIAPWGQHALRRIHAWAYRLWHARPWMLVSYGVIAAAVLLMTVPFQPGRFEINLELLRKPDFIDVRRVIVFALIAFTQLIAWVAERKELRQATVRALWRTTVLAVCLEAMQGFFVSHESSVLDALTGFAGAIFGCWGTHRLIAKGTLPVDLLRNPTAFRSDSKSGGMVLYFRPLAGLILTLAVPCAVLPQVCGLSPATLAEQSHSIRWLPFQAHFYAPFHVAIADVFESVLIYGFIAFTCRLLHPKRGKHFGLVLLVSIVMLIELYQLIVRGTPADMTSMLLAVGSWWGAGKAWKAMQPMMTGSSTLGYRMKTLLNSKPGRRDERTV